MGESEQQERQRGIEKEKAHLSPLRSAEQDAPEPERPITPDEEAGVDLQELEHPPQAEGPRDED